MTGPRARVYLLPARRGSSTIAALRVYPKTLVLRSGPEQQVSGWLLERISVESAYHATGYRRARGLKTRGYKTCGYKTYGYKTCGYKTCGYKTRGYKTRSYTGILYHADDTLM